MEILEMANIINQAGGRLYLVGGAIRDKLIGRKKQDEDYCVAGLSKEEFIKLFPQAKIRGKDFEVFDIENHEFALARTEKKIGKGHKDFEIEVNQHITIEQDLARRDITINSMAQDIITKEIIDPYGGQADIEHKVIRATSHAFIEDPLRAYRVARFVAELGFEVEENTIQLMEQLKPELIHLSKERVFVELKKALASNQPSLFFEVLRKANLLEVHFKEIYDLIGALQPIEYHPEGDSYNHTMIVVDKAAQLTNDVVIRFCALVHDLGKGATPKSMYPHHYGHDEQGVELVKKLGYRLNLPQLWIKCGKTSAKEHMKGGIFPKMTVNKKVSFIERVAKSSLGLEGLKVVVIADKCSTRSWKEEEVTFAQIGKKCLEEVNGEYIKQKYDNLEKKQFANKLHQERCIWLKNIENLDNK